MRCLVVGGDGMIGASVVGRLNRHGIDVWSTTRRPELAADRRPLLDLVKDSRSLPDDVEAIFFCAGKSPKECDSDENAARRLLVDAPVELATRYPSASFVKLSTGAVFDGSEPHQNDGNGFSPVNKYGEIHAEADRLLASRASVVRFSKVVGPNSPPIFNEWLGSLSASKTINPLSDLTFAPITLAYLTTLITKVGLSGVRGTFQASGKTDVSYAAFARMFADAIGADARLVVPRSSEELGVSLGWRPRFATLDMATSEKAFQIAAQEVGDVISYVVTLQETRP